MVNLEQLMKKLDKNNPAHQKILTSLQSTLNMYENLINDTVKMKQNELSSSVEKIVSSIDTNIQFNTEMYKTTNKRNELPNPNTFKVNAVIAATRVALNVEDFTRIEIVPVMSRSESALKAIFIARNIDGVLESSISDIMRMTTKSDTKSAIEALTAKGEFEDSVTKDLDKLHDAIQGQLEKGIGTRYQLLDYNRNKAKENIEQITKLTKEGKSLSEISENLNIQIAGLKSVENDVKAAVDEATINSNKAVIKKAIDDKKTYSVIAKDLGVNVNRLISYCKANKLVEYNEKEIIKNKIPEIEKLLNEGKTFEEIAKTLNVNQARLTSIAKNNKLSEQVKVEAKAS